MLPCDPDSLLSALETGPVLPLPAPAQREEMQGQRLAIGIAHRPPDLQGPADVGLGGIEPGVEGMQIAPDVQAEA